MIDCRLQFDIQDFGLCKFFLMVNGSKQRRTFDLQYRKSFEDDEMVHITVDSCFESGNLGSAFVRNDGTVKVRRPSLAIHQKRA